MNEANKNMGLLFMEHRQWFLRPFYFMAIVPPALALEFLVKSSAAAAAASALIVICLMVSAVVYSWAMFKSFHHGLYCDIDYCRSLQGVSAASFVFIKLASAILWLFVFAMAAAMILFLHSSLLSRLPQDVTESEIVQLGMNFVSETFGTGTYLVFSALSLFLQAIVLVTITYVAATVSHLSFCSSYKPLAGLFVLVLLYFFENDFATVLKRLLMKSIGGVEDLVSQNLKSALGAITGIEFIAYAAIILINIGITCYFLKKTRRGEIEWKR